MGLFSKLELEKINATAKKSQQLAEPKRSTISKSINTELNQMSQAVIDYFKDSKANLITSTSQLHEYVSNMIEAGIGGIDTETTGLDRLKDTIVGVSLYYPGDVEVYIPSNHIVPIFDEPYTNQLTYEQIGKELQRFVEAKTKLVFANADFDLAMIYKDLKVDLIDNCFYDVIIAWRCLKEDERDNSLKGLYNKYPLKGMGDPMKFRDFFSPQLFSYCKPEVAKLYAANDAKITYELYLWQLPYLLKNNPKCQKKKLEAVSDLVWGVEFPMISVCQRMHRRGIYLEQSVAEMLKRKYIPQCNEEHKKLRQMVQDLMDDPRYSSSVKVPFSSSTEFNPNSVPHVKWLCYDLLKLDGGKGKGTGKEILSAFNLPVTKQILKCRSLVTLISTFVEKLPNNTSSDNRIHCQFKQLGAATGRMSSAEPNMQNIPSRANDIRHMFRATPGYVLLSSDYSQQEPKLTAYVSQDENMIKSFQENKDIYSFIASIAFNKTYEECKEFTPDGEYNPEGKARRTEAKSVVLGILYGRSTVTIADQLYGNENWSDEKKVKQAQYVYDSVLNAFPALRQLMIRSQQFAKKYGYVETILGRRRHIPDMMLPEFEFVPMAGYVNPDIDPLDVTTLNGENDIPERVKKSLYNELTSYKYFGQVAKRIKSLAENDHIKVINNRFKISEATRQVVNSIIQGSAADLTKLAMLKVENDEEWKRLGGRILVPVHDELIAEVPIENWKEGGERLSHLMCEAANFLPFSIKCDVTTTYRWYGLEYPCPYKRPVSINELADESEINWVLYHLFEIGYELPVYKGPNGEKPEGDAALGISGIMSDEAKSYICDYCNQYNITDNEFISHICTKVHTGFAPLKNYQ